MQPKLRIAVDCRITNAQQGIGTAVLALAKALSDSEVTDQEYTFIVQESMTGWLFPYIHGPCKLASIPDPKLPAFSALKSVLRHIPPLRLLRKKLRRTSISIPTSDGFVESQRFDLVHFPTQMAYLTSLPSIFQPWDLQHVHHPEFFAKEDRVLRNHQYAAFSQQASCVCVQAEWTKRDVMEHLGIPAEKIAVIPWGPVFDAYQRPSADDIRLTVKKYMLPKDFFFYPAVTWPHKNHEIIFRALHILKRDYKISPTVVFTGASTDYRTILDKLARDLGISQCLQFLGFLPPVDLQAIFKAATAMIFPSRFEGFGLPILEAFHAGLPVFSSTATTLPEVAREGALYFDPDSPNQLADLMHSILCQPEMRQDLIRKGTLVLSKYSSKEMAADFRALYARTVESVTCHSGQCQVSTS
jgi:glycosyltransferase involved in cell wall biosynthesis